MIKVITYGTFDMLHQGHINLLNRAKKLGDYLIVGVTTDDFDRQRGKINVSQSLIERIEAIRQLNIADEIIVEEYEGQKIDDIKRYDIDIFIVGSDWKGKFDYLKKYCEVTYLPRTKGVSSSLIRSNNCKIKLGIVGDTIEYLNKFQNESQYVNGIEIVGICTNYKQKLTPEQKKLSIVTNNYDELLKSVDALYIKSEHKYHYSQIKKALKLGKSVLCESPITLNEKQCIELFELAKANNCILMDAIRTAYSTAYERLLLLLRSGKIGDIVSINVTCTSIKKNDLSKIYSLQDWGANALLPIFQILGVDYLKKSCITKYYKNYKNDLFTKIDFIYNNAIASMFVAENVKSEGELIISGTKGYVYVPAPWWKTDYFEIRYEDQNKNQRYFYQLDGEGIRYELVSFYRAIINKKNTNYISPHISKSICRIMEDFIKGIDVQIIK